MDYANCNEDKGEHKDPNESGCSMTNHIKTYSN